MHVLGAAKLRSKHGHQHPEIFRPFCRVAGQITQDRVEHAGEETKHVLIICEEDAAPPADLLLHHQPLQMTVNQ